MGNSKEVDDRKLRRKVAEALDRWPSAGVAVAVVRDGSIEWFLGHGVADVDSRQPITDETVFRVGSLTKTFTAVAVMQLAERGLVDLDAPASSYLRGFRLAPARPTFQPTVRNLLTHTGGVGYWRRLSDLLQPAVGSGDLARASGAPRLSEYYRAGLPVEIEPGTKWVYSNHGFAALGQIVEDVTDEPLDRYLREQLFAPLGMEQTDLVRSQRVRERLANGYVLRSRGLKAVADREILTPGGSGVYSSAADIARYVSALLRITSGEQKSVVTPRALAEMFQPQFQPDPRLPGMGLGFELARNRHHRVVRKGGTMSGFLSAFSLAPDEGVGVVVLTNTGGLDNRGIAEPLAGALLRQLLGLPDTAVRTDIPPHPEIWHELCGWYAPDPGPVTNLFTRATLGAGVEVAVRGGHLTLTPLHPIPAMRQGMRLHPDDPEDPCVFRVELAGYGFDLPLAFSRGAGSASETRLVLDLFSLRKRPDVRNPRKLVNAAAAAGAGALVLAYARHRRAGRLDGHRGSAALR
jgi:CubicO group peptidase (beta-lactamase class C family)